MDVLQRLKQQWAEWQAAWRQVREERRRHKEQRMQISVPWTRWCDLLLAEERLRQEEQRSKRLMLQLAVSIEERVRLEAANGELCAALFSSEDLRAPGLPDVTRLELAPPVKKGFDA